MNIVWHKLQLIAILSLVLMTVFILGFVLLTAVAHVNGWHAVLSSGPNIIYWNP